MRHFCIWNILTSPSRDTSGIAAAVINTAFTSTHTFSSSFDWVFTAQYVLMGQCKGEHLLVRNACLLWICIQLTIHDFAITHQAITTMNSEKEFKT
jgi:hypothetical protein